ncbi:polysaccharide deacetylase family protein [Marivita sp. GX14005]|uniref:polysaccharide deacetylase family protein n=1 Tax=Marivita sp. GX14005 TaxID=2942276 RepID=UPI002018E91E|nr:polysaccharide deacetylase family protein [Marivita sp. GX14005]MCL3882658.1 polysaccharide deacetylase family protein [Marivita sp. GX14005]
MTDLAHHGRYGFSPITERPDFDWPGGARLALYVGLNIEWFSFDSEEGAALAQPKPAPDVMNYAWRDYGNRVGIWRMFDLFDRLDLPVAGLVNDAVADHAPQIIERLRARGDEIVAHGHANTQAPGQLSAAEEAKVLHRARSRLADAFGATPKGYLAPLISESFDTPDLLCEAGYEYLLDWAHDEQPVWMQTEHGRILSVPYPQELNDVPQIMARQREASAFADMIRTAFALHLRESAQRPVVMGIALHPYLMGQAHRFDHLARVLQELRDRADARVWFTTPGAISDHFRTLDR